jgi:flagellar hook-basal body protein
MNQTQSAGSAPGSQSGGTNPRQIGLGVASGSVDIDTRQGALLSTGRTLDLAIQGDGFFKITRVNPQDGTFYSRVGNFGFDQKDDLVDLASGLRVNGLQNGVQGAISLTQYRSINATATRVVTFQGNLSANSPSLRGSTLKSVLPMVAASADRSSFSPATENSLLKDLTLFRGDGADAGQSLSGSVTTGGAASETLKGATTVNTGGRVSVKISVPAGDFSASPTRFSIQRGGVTVGTVLVNQDLSGPGVTAAARTFTVDTSVNVNAGDAVTLLATEETAGNGTVAGDYSYDTTMYTDLTIFGTKPDGEVYGGRVSIDPWKDTAGDLVAKINTVLTHGTRTFGSVQLENGNLTAKALEPGDGFSLFIGEDNKLPLGAPESASASAAGGLNPGAGSVSHTPGNTTVVASAAAGGDGALRPTFTIPASDLSAQIGSSLLVTVKVNGASAGTITIPAANYTVVSNVFTLQSFPQVKATDTISYEVTGNLGLGGGTVASPTAGTIDATTVIGKLTESTTAPLGFNYRGVSTSNVASVTMGSSGLLSPTFTMPAVDLSSQVGRSLKVSVKINGSERGSISIPPADYTGGVVKEFTMANLPHVKAGDVVTYDFSGTLDVGAGNPIGWSTALVKDSDTTSIVQDRDASGTPNGQPDLFEDSPTDPITTDINRWQYSTTNNTNFNWYRARFSPEVVTTTIDVYDTNGTKHNLEARYFKSGTKVDAITGSRSNIWDMVANINPAEGALNGDLVTGIQFDNLGRYTGDATLGTTARGVGLDANGYRGQPDNNRLEVTWNASGPTNLQLYLGQTNGTDGLTGFGTASTAAAINQDGFANGSLESMSVQANGDIKGLYSNGQNQTIATLQIFAFRNSAGLLSAGGNLWQPSSNSGQETPRTPGQGGAGQITSGSLEGSNVDIASEFTRLITAQRGFQVSARVIQTTDSVLEELANLTR